MHVKYKKKPTCLHWTDLEYCSKQSSFLAFYLCIFEISAVQKEAKNGEKKQLQSRWNEERGTLLRDTEEMQIKQEETLFQ